MAAAVEHLDVIVIGAGLSGVDAAHHLVTECPWASFAILEGRERVGGTWDLFRYPGIRSDSDMYTFSYPWRPWNSDEGIGSGGDIRDYIEDTAHEDGTFDTIRFGHRVTRLDWSSDDHRWNVSAERTLESGEVEPVELTCSFVMSCTGYYRYDRGYLPEWEGMDRYGGTLVHPQFWPEDLDLTGKRVVVIGSGATAITLVPELAKVADRVVMLQRSPTYVVSLPRVNPVDKALRRVLPDRVAGAALRWAHALGTQGSYQLSRRRPAFMKRVLRRGLERDLPAGFDIDTHFTPHYDPWDQRLCVVTDGDLFAAIAAGSVDVVTDHIDSFDETGIRLRSGDRLDADVVITATGLEVLFLGGMDLVVDGSKVDPATRLTYKGMMLEDVPNLAVAIGYTNASWTLKSDLTCGFTARILNHLHHRGLRSVVAHNTDGAEPAGDMMGLTSGYITRAARELPRQGTRYPWQVYQSYVRDYRALKRSDVEDGVLTYS